TGSAVLMYSYTTVWRMKAFRLSSSSLSFTNRTVGSRHAGVPGFPSAYHSVERGSRRDARPPPVRERRQLREHETVADDRPHEPFPERLNVQHSGLRDGDVVQRPPHEQPVGQTPEHRSRRAPHRAQPPRERRVDQREADRDREVQPDAEDDQPRAGRRVAKRRQRLGELREERLERRLVQPPDDGGVERSARHAGDGAADDAVEALFSEGRTFPPSPAFAAQANAKPGIYDEAERDYLAWWKSWADKLDWMKAPTKILEWDEPFARWFADGELNASVNALDRHVEAGKAAKIAFYYEGEPGDRWTVTYGQLLDEVCRFANGLRALGVKKGDRVAIYMPMIVELPVAMLACARIGAAHSVIFGGFSPDAIVDRVNDSQCVAIVTADQGWRRGNKVPLKANVDEAIAKGMP